MYRCRIFFFRFCCYSFLVTLLLYFRFLVRPVETLWHWQDVKIQELTNSYSENVCFLCFRVPEFVSRQEEKVPLQHHSIQSRLLPEFHSHDQGLSPNRSGQSSPSPGSTSARLALQLQPLPGGSPRPASSCVTHLGLTSTSVLRDGSVTSEKNSLRHVVSTWWFWFSTIDFSQRCLYERDDLLFDRYNGSVLNHQTGHNTRVISDT